MFFCALRGALVFLCRACDRRHRFCSTECAAAKYGRNRNATARWRSKTDKGRSQNAERQRRWRERQRERRESLPAAPHPVTYHQASAAPSTAKHSQHMSKSPRPNTPLRRPHDSSPSIAAKTATSAVSVANTGATERLAERSGPAQIGGAPDRRNQADLDRRLQLSSTMVRGAPPSRWKARSWSSHQARVLDCHASSQTDLRLHPRVRANSLVRRYLPVSEWRTIGPVP